MFRYFWQKKTLHVFASFYDGVFAPFISPPRGKLLRGTEVLNLWVRDPKVGGDLKMGHKRRLVSQWGGRNRKTFLGVLKKQKG